MDQFPHDDNPGENDERASAEAQQRDEALREAYEDGYEIGYASGYTAGLKAQRRN